MQHQSRQSNQLSCPRTHKREVGSGCFSDSPPLYLSVFLPFCASSITHWQYMTRTSPRHLWVTFALLSTSFHISRILAAYQAIPREHLITYIMEIISKSRTLACALACAEYAPISGICSMTDATRPYTAPDFLLSVNSCIQSACEGSDRDEALAYVRERCGAAELSSEYQPSLWSAAFISQLHRPRQVSTSTVVGTESFIPDQATSTRPSAAGSQITVTVSIPSASATRFATGTAVSVAHSGVKKSSAPLIVGVIIGVGAFIVSVFTVMYVLRRRRSQRSKIKGQRYLPSIAPQAGHNFDTGGHLGDAYKRKTFCHPKQKAPTFIPRDELGQLAEWKPDRKPTGRCARSQRFGKRWKSLSRC